MSLMSAGTELKRFARGKLPKLALVVLLFIPLIYGALYLWAFWAPTDNLDKLPVAIVNLDEPAKKPDGGTLTAGDDLVTKLLDGGDLAWKTMGADEARRGVADGEVYFSVTIPEGFSETLAGIETNPKPGVIRVNYNDSNSFLASTLGKQAMAQVRGAVAETTTRTAANTLLVGVEKLSDGTRDAAQAATKLDGGAVTLAAGTQQLTVGLGELADGTAQLVAKAPTLTSGTARLTQGVTQLSAGAGEIAGGADRLASGTSQLSGGVTKLAGGAAELDGALGLLAGGSQQLAGGADELSGALGQLAGGTSQLSGGATKLAGAAGQLTTSSAQLSGGMQAILGLAAKNPGMTLAEFDAALQQQGSSLQALVSGAQSVSDGAAALSAGAQDLATHTASVDAGAQRAKAGGASLAEKSGALAAGAAKAQQGSQTLVGGFDTLTGKVAELSDGAAKVSSGASTLYAKSGEAVAGSRELAAGAAQLAAGGSELNGGAQRAGEGAAQLAEGAGELHNGTSEFSGKLATGAAEAPSFTQDQVSRMSDTIAAPVSLDERVENPVQGFGGGFAPFFMALASFVGALITWLILRALPRRPLVTGVSGLRSVLTGFWPAALIAVGQVVIMMLVLVYGIGLRPDNWIGTSLFLLLTTLAFLALQQMFIVLLGTAAGRVVSLVLLMLQLSSSGGTYPVETTPGFFQFLHPLMPASYVVDGLRQMIGGGVDARFWVALAVMLGVLIVSLVLSAFAAGKQKVWRLARLHPELAI